MRPANMAGFPANTDKCDVITNACKIFVHVEEFDRGAVADPMPNGRGMYR